MFPRLRSAARPPNDPPAIPPPRKAPLGTSIWAKALKRAGMEDCAPETFSRWERKLKPAFMETLHSNAPFRAAIGTPNSRF